MQTPHAESATFSVLIPFLGAIAAIGPLSNDLYVPSMAVVAQALNVTGASVQLTMSAVLLGFSCGALIYGPLSDRFGRKNVLCLGLAMYIVAAWLAARSPTLELLVAARAAQGFAAASGMVLSRAIILDRWRGNEASRALSWVSIFMFVEPVVAPLIGGWVASFGYWPAVFWAQGAIGLICLAVTIVLLPRVSRKGDHSMLSSLRAYLPIARDGQALGYIFMTACGFIGVVAFVTTASFVFVDYFGLNSYRFGACFSTVMLGGSIGAWVNGHYVSRLGISRMLAFGVSCIALGGSAVLVSGLAGGGVPGLVGGFMLYMFGIGFVFANAVARTLSRFPHAMGAASSIFGVFQFLLGAIVAAMLSRIVVPSPMPMAWTVAVSGIACASIWWLGLSASAPLRD
jgi:DHA1 family bicyclomycin/chloramphenicol resistance-like MFS transporter